MDALEAAEVVLRNVGSPMNYRKLTQEILARGLWETKGKTPDATVRARLGTHLNAYGNASVFQRTGPGTYALREWGLPEYTGKGAKGQADAEAPAGPAIAPPEQGAPANPESVDEPALHVVPPPSAPAEPRDNAGPAMSFANAAAHVLEVYGNQEPMHYREITERALREGLIQTEGKTPAASLYAQILTEIKRQRARDEVPRFVKHGRGLVGLSQWLGSGLAYEIARHNQEVQRALLGRLREMSPDAFEELIAELLVALGFEEVQLTSYSKDGGIDVRGTLVVGEVIRTRMAVQVKRWKNNVGATVVQQVRGSLGTHEQGLIITTSDFGKRARLEAARADAVPVGLMDGRQLVDLLIENDIGIVRKRYDLIELD